MNIETLKAFRDLVETGSFSKTAEINYVSQSAISQQVKKLELVYKTKLLMRISNKMRPTSSGETLYKAARKILITYDDAVMSIKQSSPHKTDGKIKISTIYSVGNYVLQGYIRKFMKTRPMTEVDVEYRRFSQVYNDIASGKADFGILACNCSIKNKNLVVSCIRKEEMVLIAGVGSRFADMKIVNIRDIAGKDFIFFDKVFPSRKYIDGVFRKNKVKVNVKMELDNIETIKTFVKSGLGLSIIPKSAVGKHEKDIDINIIKLSDVKFERPLSVIYNRNKRISSAKKEFLKILNSTSSLSSKKHGIIPAGDKKADVIVKRRNYGK